MIKVFSSIKNKKVISFEAKGHALYDESGKDIVCASASTLFIVTSNAIESLGLNDHIEVKIDEGYFLLTVKKENEIVNKLIINMINSVIDLQQQYPKFIKYFKKEE